VHLETLFAKYVNVQSVRVETWKTNEVNEENYNLIRTYVRT